MLNNMERGAIINRLLCLISQNGIVDQGYEILENTSLIDECGLDSVGVIDLVMCIEEEFGFEFDDTELDLFNFKCVCNIADLVQSKINM